MKHFSGWCFPHHTSAKILLLKLLAMQLPELNTSAPVFETLVLALHHLLIQQGWQQEMGAMGQQSAESSLLKGNFLGHPFPFS